MMVIGVDASRAVTQQRTGTEAYATFLIRSLIPHALQKGHSLRLYFNQPPPPNLLPNHLLIDQVEQIVIPFPRLWTHGRLGHHLYKNPPDLFFTPAHVIPLLYTGTSVATIHDLGYHHFPEAHPRLQRLYLKWSTRHNCRISSKIVADSIATKNDIVEFYNISPENIEVIYPGIDPELKPIEDRETITAVLQKFNITLPFFLYVGTLQPRKNLIRLVDAFVQSGVEAQLVLAGRQGWLAEPLLQHIATLPEKDKKHILLTGYITELEKRALLTKATALLFPSLYEGFGFPVLEAQVCKTAVLTSTSSSLPEVAGKGALLVDPLDSDAIADGIRQLFDDSELRQRLIEKGTLNSKQFRWETAVYELLSLFEQII